MKEELVQLKRFRLYKQKKEKFLESNMSKRKVRFIKRDEIVWKPNLIKDFNSRTKN